MKIKFSTKGELTTIPEIKPAKLMKVIGINGIGKSMAAVFLEIASGNYRFKNENQFIEIKNRFQECIIKIETNKDFLEIFLTPGTWVFNKNDFKLEEDSIGFFKQNGKTIVFDKFKEILSVKIVRGDENFETQLKLVSNIFIDILDKYLNDISTKISKIKEYQNNFDTKTNFKLLTKYKEIQNNYSELNNGITKAKDEFQKISSEIDILKTKINIIGSIIIWNENDPEVMQQKISSDKSQIEIYEKKFEDITIELNEIEKLIENIEKKKRVQIKKYIEEKNKQDKKKGLLIKKISKNFPNDVKDIIKAKNIEATENLIENKKDTLKNVKENYDLSITGEIKIKNTLLEKFKLIKNILNESISEGLGDRTIIEDYYEEIFLEIKIEELNNFIKNRILILEKSPEHITQIEKLEELSKDFNSIKLLLENIKEWKKIINKDNELQKWKTNLTSNNLDQFLEPEIIKNSLDKQDKLLNDKQQINMKLTGLKTELNEFSKRLELAKKLKTRDLLKSELQQFYSIIPDNLNDEKDKIEEELNLKITKKNGLEYNLDNLNNKKESLEKQINQIKEKMMKIASEFKYQTFLNWTNYLENHSKKIIKLINEIFIPFYDFIKRLRDLFFDIERDKPIKNIEYLPLISEIYNRFFLETYNNPSFFKYVFTGYKEIKDFDIIEKKIVFIKENNSEDHRSLIDFSSGEKAYAFIRAMINLFREKSKYKILFIDEANALMDYLRSGDLLDFQIELINEGHFDKIINILPIKNPPNKDSKYYQEYSKTGYYQEIIQF